MATKALREGAVRGLVAAFLACSACACSTVVLTEGRSAERRAPVEREALVEAAAALSETKWPAAQSASWRERIAGIGGAGRETDRATRFYLASMESQTHSDAVFADASRHLSAAAALADAAEAAAASARPARADLVVVERAMSDLRQCRDVYLASLKTLAHEGEALDEAAVRELVAAFNGAIALLGEAADNIADNISRRRAQTRVASPAGEDEPL